MTHKHHKNAHHHHEHHVKEKNHHHHDKEHEIGHPTRIERSPKVRDFSIFNQVTVNAPVRQDQDKEDGISSCFKALFQCCRPRK